MAEVITPKKYKPLGNQELNKLVVAEAKKLKETAQSSELKYLSFDDLQTDSRQSCIYGQITGDCFSERAIYLIEASCERVFNVVPSEKILGKLNGKPVNKARGSYWSPIEVFIDRKRNKENGNNKRLIDFLKGKTQTIELI